MIAQKVYDLTWGEAEGEGCEPDWGAGCTVALHAYGIGVWGVAEVVGTDTIGGASNVPADPYGTRDLTLVWADLHWPSVPAAARAWRLASVAGDASVASVASDADDAGTWLPDERNDREGGEPPSFGYVLATGQLADALLDCPDADARLALRVHAPDGSHRTFEGEVIGGTWDGGDGVERVLCETGPDAPWTCELIARAALAGDYDHWLSRHSRLVCEDLEGEWRYPWGDEPW